jgi:lysophospholipase L1-like esterase
MRWICLILLVFYLVACQEAPLETSINARKDSVSITLLALGDSYTVGQGVQISERFPAQLQNILRNKGIKTRHIGYLAQSGWTSAELNEALSGSNPGMHDYVSVLIGVNDQFQGLDSVQYAKNLTSILTRAVGLAQGIQEHVIVLSIPDYGLTPIGLLLDTAKIHREIDGFNRINQRLAKANQCRYVNITEIGRSARNNPTYTSADGLHPSAEAYQKWAEAIAPSLQW